MAIQRRSVDFIRLDISKGKVRKSVSVFEGDSNFRTLCISVCNNGTPVDMSDLLFAEILIHKSDGHEADNGCVIDGDTIQYTLRSNDVSSVGTNTAQVMLTYKDGTVLTTPIFIIEVFSKVLDQSVQKSINEYTSITQQLVLTTQRATEAKESADNAALSEEKSKASEETAKQSEINAAESEINAKASEEAAATSAGVAQESQERAAISESNAKEYEESVIQKAEDILNAEYHAQEYATSAEESYQAAKQSETHADASEKAAALSEEKSKASEETAKQSEINAKASENAAALSEKNSKSSENAAALSESNAEKSATSAALSESNASVSEINAGTSADAAELSETNAKKSETSAAESENKSKTSEMKASTSETNAKEYAAAAERYYEQAKTISESFHGALRPMGTKAFEEVPDLSETSDGDMYNISNAFMTTEDFVEGAGHEIPLGSNIYVIVIDGVKKWDVLAGSPVTGVKGSNETYYRSGNVNIESKDIAYDGTNLEAENIQEAIDTNAYDISNLKRRAMEDEDNISSLSQTVASKASETDFAEHKNDATSHITEMERTAWNEALSDLEEIKKVIARIGYPYNPVIQE